MCDTTLKSLEDIAHFLRKKGLSPTLSRVHIFKALQSSATHPSVEELYQSLKAQIPSLSKTTVYNILHNLVERGIVLEIFTDPKEKRYELPGSPHAHFSCDRCNTLYDLETPRDLSRLPTTEHTITSVQILYKGICKKCREKS